MITMHTFIVQKNSVVILGVFAILAISLLEVWNEMNSIAVHSEFSEAAS